MYIFSRYLSVPKGNIGVYDPAEIHNRQQLKNYMKEAMVKLACHLVFFFIYLYRYIYVQAYLTYKDTDKTFFFRATLEYSHSHFLVNTLQT